MNLRKILSEHGQALTGVVVITGTVLVAAGVITISGGVLQPGTVIQGEINGTPVSLVVPTSTNPPPTATNTATRVPTPTFTATIPPTAHVEGRVSVQGVGLGGVIITVDGQGTVSNPDGSYAVHMVPTKAEWVVMPSLTGWSFIPPTRTVYLTQTVTGVDFEAIQNATPTQTTSPTPSATATSVVTPTVTPTFTRTPTRTPTPTPTPTTTPNPFEYCPPSSGGASVGITYYGTDDPGNFENLWGAVSSGAWYIFDDCRLSIGITDIQDQHQNHYGPAYFGASAPIGTLTVTVNISDSIPSVGLISLRLGSSFVLTQTAYSTNDIFTWVAPITATDKFYAEVVRGGRRARTAPIYVR